MVGIAELEERPAGDGPYAYQPVRPVLFGKRGYYFVIHAAKVIKNPKNRMKVFSVLVNFIYYS
jgi:hypothetical protein